MIKNPKMIFKAPGPHEWEGVAYDWMICEAEDAAAHIAQGWHNTFFEATAATPAESLADRAAALGIKVDGRWSEERLKAEIEKATP